MLKLNKTEGKRGNLPDEDYKDNIETIFKNSLYLNIRSIYNDFIVGENRCRKGVESAIYYLIRDLCYSGMFRYNLKGEFNVPYGGMSYNNKIS